MSAAYGGALADYVHRPDAHYAWALRGEESGLLAHAYVLTLTSQQWLDKTKVDRPLWTHDLRILQPRRVCGKTAHTSHTAILVVSGGGNHDSTDPAPRAMPPGTSLVAQSFCRPVIELRQVPNQRLTFSDESEPRKEDALLAYSLDRFLQEKPGDWPTHLAMVKAVVRAMDAAQEFSRTRKDIPDIDDFVLIGASKRGWTTWLTATVDPRVRAIVPISIDMPNLSEQLPAHLAAYGDYARALMDYKAIDLGCRMHSERGRELLEIIDPWSYRDQLQLPKLVLNSAGDEFFLPDASQRYFPGLPGDNRLRYTPNTDHRQHGADRITLFRQARNWVDDVVAGKAPPSLRWERGADDQLVVNVSTRPRAVRLWQADNPAARDFRQETLGAVWQETRLQAQPDGSYRATLQAPPKGWRAAMVEVTFGGMRRARQQVYTTPVFVLPETMPFAGRTACTVTPASLPSRH